jgi:hypothetical protein
MAETESFKQRIALVIHWLGFGIGSIALITSFIGGFMDLKIMLGVWLSGLMISVLLSVGGWFIRWLLVGGKVPFLPYQD